MIIFACINLTWVFFQAPTAGAAFTVLQQTFAYSNSWVLIDEPPFELGIRTREFWVVMIAILLLLYVGVMHEKGLSFHEDRLRQRLWFRWAVYLGMTFAALLSNTTINCGDVGLNTIVYKRWKRRSSWRLARI